MLLKLETEGSAVVIFTHMLHKAQLMCSVVLLNSVSMSDFSQDIFGSMDFRHKKCLKMM